MSFLQVPQAHLFVTTISKAHILYLFTILRLNSLYEHWCLFTYLVTCHYTCFSEPKRSIEHCFSYHYFFLKIRNYKKPYRGPRQNQKLIRSKIAPKTGRLHYSIMLCILFIQTTRGRRSLQVLILQFNSRLLLLSFLVCLVCFCLFV